jgi:hypothetical protein
MCGHVPTKGAFNCTQGVHSSRGDISTHGSTIVKERGSQICRKSCAAESGKPPQAIKMFDREIQRWSLRSITRQKKSMQALSTKCKIRQPKSAFAEVAELRHLD